MSIQSGQVPLSAQYAVGGLPISSDSARRTIKLFPQNGTSGYTYGTNGTIRLDLPPSIGFLDVHNSYLSFRIRVDNSVVDMSKKCRLDKHSMSWCRNFTIQSSTGAVIEQLDHYNLLVNLLHKATSPDDYASSIGQMLDGTGDKATRNAAFAHPIGKQYVCGFDGSGILNGSTPYLPIGFLQGPLTIEMELAPFADCFVGSKKGTAELNYIIDNVEYIASVITFGQDYNAIFERQLRSDGIDISYSSYRAHTTSINSAKEDIQISQNAKSVKGVYSVLRSKGKYRSPLFDSLTTYKSGNLKEIQYNLGGREYPTFPLKLENNGFTQLYAQNLNSWNMFRNHALGSGIKDNTFASTETAAIALPTNGVTTASVHPLRRIYGRWFCNQPQKQHDNSASANTVATQPTCTLSIADLTHIKAEVAKTPPTAARPLTIGNTVVNGALAPTKHYVKTLTFRPDDARDLAAVEMGIRCKMGVAVADASTAVGNEPKQAAGVFSNLFGGATATETIGNQLGLDRFYADTPAFNYKLAASKGHNRGTDAPNVLYAGSPAPFSHGDIGTSGTSDDTLGWGIGVPFVDGLNRPIFSTGDFSQVGWLDLLPDDSDFYISANFETHHESGRLISGSDLTNATPLHVVLEYDTNKTQGTTNYLEYREDNDIMTNFVHYDAILRVEPDGTLISSM
jgi:hypothetical protein